MPSSPAVRMIVRADSAPTRCPSTRGNPCCFAQRPLPSMMTATCCGNDARASALKCEVAELMENKINLASYISPVFGRCLLQFFQHNPPLPSEKESRNKMNLICMECNVD